MPVIKWVCQRLWHRIPDSLMIFTLTSGYEKQEPSTPPPPSFLFFFDFLFFFSFLFRWWFFFFCLSGVLFDGKRGPCLKQWLSFSLGGGGEGCWSVLPENFSFPSPDKTRSTFTTWGHRVVLHAQTHTHTHTVNIYRTCTLLGVKKKLLLFFIFNNFLLHSWTIINFGNT